MKPDFTRVYADRGNDFSMAGSFQISTAYLDFTYSISDFKICYNDSCLGFDSIECQTCQSDVDGESALDSGSGMPSLYSHS